MTNHLPITASDVRVIIADTMKDRDSSLHQILEDDVKHAVFDALIAEWRPYIQAMRAVLILIISSFAISFVGIVYSFLMRQ